MDAIIQLHIKLLPTEGDLIGRFIVDRQHKSIYKCQAQNRTNFQGRLCAILSKSDHCPLWRLPPKYTLGIDELGKSDNITIKSCMNDGLKKNKYTKMVYLYPKMEFLCPCDSINCWFCKGHNWAYPPSIIPTPIIPEVTNNNIVYCTCDFWCECDGIRMDDVNLALDGSFHKESEDFNEDYLLQCLDVQEEARCLDDSFLRCLDVAKNQEENQDVQEDGLNDDYSFLRCLDVAKNQEENQDVQEDALNDDYSFLRCLEEVAKNQDVQEDALNDDYSFLRCLEEEAKNQEEVKTQDAFNLQNLLCLDVPTDVLNNSFYQELIEQDKKRTYSSMSEEEEEDDGCQKKPRCNSFELSF